MSDLISRVALLDAMPKNDELLSLDVRRVICDAPAVDAVPVVHGRWADATEIIAGIQHPQTKCTACEKVYWGYKETKYCPNCGAKMDGGDYDG